MLRKRLGALLKNARPFLGCSSRSSEMSFVKRRPGQIPLPQCEPVRTVESVIQS